MPVCPLPLTNTYIHTVGTHVRYYHNDIKVPNFENYRHPKTKDPNRAAKESRDERRLTLDVVKIGVGVTGAIVAKRIGQTLVANLSPAQSTLAMERAQAKEELRDPQTDEERAYAHPSGKWLVVMANCTHLGCIPIANQGNWGGFYCPCHGSHYDASGRIRKGPAPLNLEVPDHHVLEAENKLILGLKTPAV
ncbi:unnamed protein product [Medioppia subpectinata]|uniref:Cytochrome b-c1 complex subunit Rieske, mitochondrial n=2 Tax=Medioppia subpectinata TaxID=1979941 RepID=A0A7R9Q7X8_9ACAR|nr:unnamed protein product [Medioppia subpectinata]CAG2116056.1 unnamed protein product [Medioppia subpectinata]